MKLLTTHSCIHGIFYGSSSAENRLSFPCPQTSSFQCCLYLCGAKEPPNQPKRTNCFVQVSDRSQSRLLVKDMGVFNIWALTRLFIQLLKTTSNPSVYA